MHMSAPKDEQKHISKTEKLNMFFSCFKYLFTVFYLHLTFFLSQRKNVAFSAQIHPYINCRDKSHVISLNLSSFFPWIICIFHITSIHFIVSFDFGIIFFVSKRKNKQTNKNYNYHTKYKSMISLCAIFVFFPFLFLSFYLSISLCICVCRFFVVNFTWFSF